MARPRQAAASVEGLVVGLEGIADLLNVGVSTVATWVKTEGFPKIGAGQYPVAECVRWYLRRLESETSNDIQVERRRLLVAQSAGLRFENRKREGELLPVGLVASDAAAFVGIVDEQLDLMIERAARRLKEAFPTWSDEAIRAALADEVAAIQRAARQALAAYLPPRKLNGNGHG